VKVFSRKESWAGESSRSSTGVMPDAAAASLTHPQSWVVVGTQSPSACAGRHTDIPPRPTMRAMSRRIPSTARRGSSGTPRRRERGCEYIFCTGTPTV